MDGKSSLRLCINILGFYYLILHIVYNMILVLIWLFAKIKDLQKNILVILDLITF